MYILHPNVYAVRHDAYDNCIKNIFEHTYMVSHVVFAYSRRPTRSIHYGINVYIGDERAHRTAKPLCNNGAAAAATSLSVVSHRNVYRTRWERECCLHFSITYTQFVVVVVVGVVGRCTREADTFNCTGTTALTLTNSRSLQRRVSDQKSLSLPSKMCYNNVRWGARDWRQMRWQDAMWTASGAISSKLVTLCDLFTANNINMQPFN